MLYTSYIDVFILPNIPFYVAWKDFITSWKLRWFPGQKDLPLKNVYLSALYFSSTTFSTFSLTSRLELTPIDLSGEYIFFSF